MKYLIIMGLLIGSKVLASTKSEDKAECRYYYLELIKDNPQLSSLRGGDQVEFYLNPEYSAKKMNLNLAEDSQFQSCLAIERESHQ